MNSSIQIENQKDFDGLPSKFVQTTIIKIISNNILQIKRTISNGIIVVGGNSYIHVYVGFIRAEDNSTITAHCNSSVAAWNNAFVLAQDQSQISIHDDTTIQSGLYLNDEVVIYRYDDFRGKLYARANTKVLNVC